MPDEKTVQKYIKVKQLAEAGVAGEQATAAQILRRMEQQHPGIRQAAEEYLKAQNTPKQENTRNSGLPRSWQDFFRQAEAIFETASEFVENVAEVHLGRLLADEVDIDSKVTRAGNLLITLRMELGVYREATRLNGMQRQAFRDALHELLDDQLDRLFND